MRFSKWIISATLSIASLAQASEPLTAFENVYTAKLYGFAIEATSRFQPTSAEAGTYQYYFNADSMIGSITETTNVTWSEKDQTFTPHRYTYLRKGVGKSRDDELVFDWPNRKVTNIKNNRVLPLEGHSKIQDSLSYQLQLRQDLMAGKTNLEYSLTNGRKIKKYKFELVGEEKLKTPLGEVQTIKVKRSHVDDNAEVYAWFAKDFHYLLVRLQQEENGSAYTIYLSKASVNGKAIEHF